MFGHFPTLCMKGLNENATFLHKASLGIICKFFKYFTNSGKKANRAAIDFSRITLPNILNHRVQDETFQQSGKQDSFRDLLQSSDNMYEKSGSQFFRTTTRIKSGPHAFEGTIMVMAFLTNLGVTEILCSF